MAFKFYPYLCRRLVKKQMRITKNHNYQQYAALYDKGIGAVVRTFDSLTQKDAKKMANYLVNPNNLLTHTHTHTHYMRT